MSGNMPRKQCVPAGLSTFVKAAQETMHVSCYVLFSLGNNVPDLRFFALVSGGGGLFPRVHSAYKETSCKLFVKD